MSHHHYEAICEKCYFQILFVMMVMCGEEDRPPTTHQLLSQRQQVNNNWEGTGESGYPHTGCNVQCAMYNVQCAMCNGKQRIAREKLFFWVICIS